MSRPLKSQVRQNVVDILNVIKKGHGYEIYKIYAEAYPKVTIRVIYYHLKKGLETKEFRVDRVEKSKGDYSWGSEAEKTIYALGENANPKGDEKLKKLIEKRQSDKVAKG